MPSQVARALELQMPAAAQQLSARAEELQKHLEPLDSAKSRVKPGRKSLPGERKEFFLDLFSPIQ